MVQISLGKEIDSFDYLLSSIHRGMVEGLSIDWEFLREEISEFLICNQKIKNDLLASNFELRNDEEDALLLFYRVSEALEYSCGFSFLRMGDGEGRYVGDLRISNHMRCFSDHLAKSVWFKYSQSFPKESFYRNLEEAYVNSSVIGYCPKFRLKIEEKNIWYGYLGCVNGNNFIFQKCLRENIESNHDRLVRNWTNVNLLKLPEFKEVLSSCRVGIISCHNEKSKFKSIFSNPNIELTVIPPEGHPDLKDKSGGEKMFPDLFDRICNQLEHPSSDLYLVGAGVYSKIFCEIIRKNGKVGLDMGSTLDGLIGLKTR